jgi:hypothetical protein
MKGLILRKLVEPAFLTKYLHTDYWNKPAHFVRYIKEKLTRIPWMYIISPAKPITCKEYRIKIRIGLMAKG